jgi:hypothetical protein
MVRACCSRRGDLGQPAGEPVAVSGIGGGGGSRTRVRESPLWEPTCVADSVFSGSAVRTGKSDGNLVRLISAWGFGPEPCAYPAK